MSAAAASRRLYRKSILLRTESSGHACALPRQTSILLRHMSKLTRKSNSTVAPMYDSQVRALECLVIDTTSASVQIAIAS
jgi:hypothetical protein